MTSSPLDSTVARLKRAASLLGADPDTAEREARALRDAAPGDPRPALILASALRRKGDAKGAIEILAPLAKSYPEAAMTRFELGVALAATGDAAAAQAALERATALNRDLAEAWKALGELRFRRGDARGAEAAFAQQRRSLVRDPALKSAAEAICAGRKGEAETLLRARLEVDPDDAKALGLLGEIRLAGGFYADAEALLERALRADPDSADIRFDYANALFHRRKGAEALPHLRRLLDAHPDNAAYRNLAAGAFALMGDYDRAIELYEALLRDYQGQPLIWLNYAQALRTARGAGEALAALRRAIDLDPDLTEAYLSLANLKVATFTAAEVAAMRRVAERQDLRAEDRLQLHFALGKALEDAGDHAAAFAHYAEGAARQRRATPYEPAALSAHVARCRELFTAEFFASRPGFGAAAADPIFIVGLPRSGSTLIEQILASHSAIEGTMELPDIGSAAFELGWMNPAAPPPGYPGSVAALTAVQAASLGEAYIAATRVHRKLGRPFFTDKMPSNFQHLGLIQLMLPNARIIDARRHPLGACFSAFKQHFSHGMNFSYDLGDLGLYYRDYVALMDHFDAVLPGRVHRVIYEDMVENTEDEVRRLLAHCGLDFQAACLAFHENDRAVRTVSSEQVRRPIYRDGLDQWRHYEPWLGPLKEALGPALDWRKAAREARPPDGGLAPGPLGPLARAQP
jgi:predicted Zn-dependent protease